MAIDRVGELFDGGARRRRPLVGPEGVAMSVQIAGLGERAGAFAIDIAFMFGAFFLVAATTAVAFSGRALGMALPIALLVAFVVRNVYFMHFELATQGGTPGKKVCGLRVINRSGGELTPSAVIARNLTREVEFYVPLSLLLDLDADRGLGWQLALLGWMLLVTSLPLWNRDRLRLGDIVAGTQVIAIPRRFLSYDLSTDAPANVPARYRFTDRQLSFYGEFELQVLEELLRQPRSNETENRLRQVCERIRSKIGWVEEVPAVAVRLFLTEFYAAQRAVLERGRLFGKRRADKG